MKTSRFSGFDWATELKHILVVGVGGIGSWTALNLARIGHELILVDPDSVDETNVLGGQLFKLDQIGKDKVNAVLQNCRDFGCVNTIDVISEYYSEEDTGVTDIFVTGLDNMKARKQCFEAWEKHVVETENKQNCLFVDGRLSGELSEVFCVKGSNPEQIEEYKKWLFDDSDIPDLDCTVKQTTFMAMNISSLITASICNFLSNLKTGMELREVPFHQKFYSPSFSHNVS